MAIDIICFLVFSYGAYVGYTRGIINTFFSLVSWLFGLMAAFKFAPGATRLLEDTFNSENPLMFLAGFVLAFMVTMMILRLIGKGLEGILKTVNINIINRVVGSGVLAGIMVLVYSVILWFGDSSNIINEEAKYTSRTYPYLKEFPGQVRVAFDAVQPTFEEFWDESVEFMDKIQEMGVDRSESDPNIFDIDDTPAKRTSDSTD